MVQVGARLGSISDSDHPIPAVTFSMGDSPKELYLFKGSQFVIKAMAAMALKGMLPGDGSYIAREVPLALKGRKKLLPPPHTVPVMRWGNDVIPGRQES